MTLGNEPKTARSKRTVPIARSVMRRLEQHLATYVGPEADALVSNAPRGGPLARNLFSRRAWRPAVDRAGIPSIPSTASGTALSRSWSRLAATSERSVGRPQQCRLHPHPLRWAHRGRVGGSRRPARRPAGRSPISAQGPFGELPTAPWMCSLPCYAAYPWYKKQRALGT